MWSIETFTDSSEARARVDDVLRRVQNRLQVFVERSVLQQYSIRVLHDVMSKILDPTTDDYVLWKRLYGGSYEEWLLVMHGDEEKVDPSRRPLWMGYRNST